MDFPDWPELSREGVALRRGAVTPETIYRLRESAQRCLLSAAEGTPPEHYRYSPYATSVTLRALLDFGCSESDLLAPLAVDAFEPFHRWGACRFDASWARIRYAPALAPRLYHPNAWHQDGGLGGKFGPDPGDVPQMVEMITCWFPLDDCLSDRPSLEFVRRPLSRLLHYTELHDAELRERFRQEEFWTAEALAGDALVFPGGTLHRTWEAPSMTANRLSVEYRFFSA